MIKKIQVKDQSGSITGTYDVGQVAPEVAEKIDNLLNEETGSIQYTTKTNGVDVTLRGSNNVDLRCEDRGGIALQPKGFDGSGAETTTTEYVVENGTALSDIEEGADGKYINLSDHGSRIVFDSECEYVLKMSWTGNLTSRNSYVLWLGDNSTVGSLDGGTVLLPSVLLPDNANNTYELSLNTLPSGGNKLIDTVSNSEKFYLCIGQTPNPSYSDGSLPAGFTILLVCKRTVYNNMNKIKFEHGGGDGLEFGTFDTEKTSLYTNEYRFKKGGVLKLATRATQVSNNYDASDETTHYKYIKQDDDFYDIISNNDPTCTWEDIITFVNWAKTRNYGPWAV